MCMETGKSRFSAKPADIGMLSALEMTMELSIVTSDMLTTLFEVAKKYEVNEFEIMRMAANIIARTADDPKFHNEIAPTIWKLIDNMEKDTEE